MASKITIIGAGSVGSTIAYTMAVNGITSEVVLIDINKDKAYGEAMDIRQGTPFCSPITIYAGDYSDSAGSDIVIITSGLPRKPGQSRIDLAQNNVNIIKDIAGKVVKYAPEAMYILVSNPVDILTYAFIKQSGLPYNQVIGSGTTLDTARLRSKLSDIYSVNQKNIHAYVMGEHGDSSFIPWSIANIAGISLDEYSKITVEGKKISLNTEEISDYVKTSGGKIISCKGVTNFAIAVSVARICECLYYSKDTVMTVSTMMQGEFGIEDVCLSFLSVVGNGCKKGNITPPLNDSEIEKLRHSANVLKDIIKGMEF